MAHDAHLPMPRRHEAGAAASRYRCLAEIRPYRCGPCGYVFTEAESFEHEQRALTLDLRAGGEAIRLQ